MNDNAIVDRFKQVGLYGAHQVVDKGSPLTAPSGSSDGQVLMLPCSYQGVLGYVTPADCEIRISAKDGGCAKCPRGTYSECHPAKVAKQLQGRKQARNGSYL
jgi:hypothetical protein